MEANYVGLHIIFVGRKVRGSIDTRLRLSVLECGMHHLLFTADGQHLGQGDAFSNAAANRNLIRFNAVCDTPEQSKARQWFLSKHSGIIIEG